MSYGYSTETQVSPTPASVPSPYYGQPRRKSGGWLMPLLLIGGGVVILGGVLCFAAVWYVVANIDRMLVGLGREAIVAMIDESDLPPAEKTEVIAQVDRVVAAYKEGKIDQNDMQRVLAELENSPLLTVVALYGLEEHYLADADLSPAEQADARRTYERVLRGVHERKISEDDVYSCLPVDPFDDPSIDDARTVKEMEQRMLEAAARAEAEGDDGVRLMFARFRTLADEAGIPNESYRVGVGAEFKRLVDTVLEGKQR